MFENNADVDFGDDFTLNFAKVDKGATNKRPLEHPERETSKKQKIYQLSKNVIKRKFPGPAGILPDRKGDSSWELPKSKEHEEIPCSQMSLSVFETSPWVDMSRDFDSLIDVYDIKWIKKWMKKLPNQKVPFLAAIIKSIECIEGKNLKVVLKDTSGEIQGTIIHSLSEEYSNSLVPGSVIVLRQCSVLTCSSNNHYLTITQKNLVTIYWKNKDETVVISVQESSAEDFLVGLKQVQKSVQGKDERFGKENEAPSSSQLKIKGSREEVELWEDALEGIDMDSFLEDF